MMSSALKKVTFTLLLLQFALLVPILQPTALKNDMFTIQISGKLDPLQPTLLGISALWPYPVDIYQISAMRAKHQFLPSRYPPTEVFAYGGKVNGVFKPSFPGPSILAFKNTPIYVIYTNDIGGQHILPVDRSPPFDMVAEFLDQVPTVPHAHGLETQMGSDGQPMGFWTKSGRKGTQYFSLNSRNKKSNQAIYRYWNTKQGLFWYHDHSMAITRLNVYAGLVGFYEIVDPQISLQQNNILKNVGDIERRYFAIVDKSFKQDGSLYYPDKSNTQDFTSWVPQFFGNTMTVNGKIWPKIVLQAKMHRFVFLNGCQSRLLNIYFEHKGKKLDFHIFRRDSDFLRKPVLLKQHLLLTGARIQIFINLRGLTGQILLKNSASAPYPMGIAPDEFTSNILKIQIGRNFKSQPSATARNPNFAPVTDTSSSTFTSAIKDRLNFYQSNKTSFQSIQGNLDFLDEPQTANSDFLDSSSQLRTTTKKQSTGKVISIADFLDSNDPRSVNSVNFVQQNIAARGTALSGSTITKSAQLFRATDPVDRNLVSIVDFLLNQTNTNTANNMNFTILDVPYPRFATGKPYFPILNEVRDNNGQPVTVKIDDMSLEKGCLGAQFKQDQTYDFYIINLTMDDHPIHMHLINFQVIGRFKFNIQKYISDWKLKNGEFQARGLPSPPTQIDPRPYKTSEIFPPLQQQKLFTDVIHAPTEQVTIVRLRFYNHYGKKFPFEVQGSRYVFHCHILEHEDNQMMRYFCIE